MQKHTLLIIVIMLLLVGITSSQELSPTGSTSLLESYADYNFKDYINYKDFSVQKVEQYNNIVIIYVNIDGKDVRWLTSKGKYDTITENAK